MVQAMQALQNPAYRLADREWGVRRKHAGPLAISPQRTGANHGIV